MSVMDGGEIETLTALVMVTVADAVVAEPPGCAIAVA
jgi:hypothetical protein